MMQHLGKEQEFKIVGVHCSESHQLEKYSSETECFIGKTVFAVTLHGGQYNFLVRFCIR